MAEKKGNTGITYGLIAGLLMIVISLVLYLGGVKMFLSPVAYLSYLVIITIAVLAGLRQKKLNGGYIEFSEALKVVFSVFAIGFLMQIAFMFVLLNYIDIPFREALAQETIEATISMMKRMGVSESTIEDAMKADAGADNYSIGKMLLGYAIWCIVFFIVSLIIAAIIKRKKPVFDNSFNQ